MRGLRWRRSRPAAGPTRARGSAGAGRRLLGATAAGVIALVAGTVVWLAMTAGPTVARLQEEARYRALTAAVSLPLWPTMDDDGAAAAAEQAATDSAIPPASGGDDETGDTLRSLLQTQLAAAPPPPPPPPAGDEAGGDTGADGGAPSAGGRDLPAAMMTEPLPPAPVADLVEDTLFGPLPRIAEDGRMPWRDYARPFDATRERPRVSIIITGLGRWAERTQLAIDTMPAPITLAFSPYAEDVSAWLDLARADGHETLLMLPMEPTGYPQNDPGPQALLVSVGPEENRERLQRILGRGTGYVGLIGYMGSRFASSQEALTPMLQTLADRGILYVDNRPGPDTVATRVAGEIGVAHAVVDRVIDETATPDTIDLRLRELEDLARAEGTSVGLAQGYPVTLARLAAWAATLEAKAIDLAPIAAVTHPRSGS